MTRIFSGLGLMMGVVWYMSRGFEEGCCGMKWMLRGWEVWLCEDRMFG